MNVKSLELQTIRSLLEVKFMCRMSPYTHSCSFKNSKASPAYFFNYFAAWFLYFINLLQPSRTKFLDSIPPDYSHCLCQHSLLCFVVFLKRRIFFLNYSTSVFMLIHNMDVLSVTWPRKFFFDIFYHLQIKI